MQAGKLKHEILIQQQTTTQNNYGEPQNTWTTVFTCWANIKPLVGREFLDASRINSDLTHDVTIRYRDGVYPKMRISYDSRYFDIISVINSQEAGQWLFLKCRELI